MAILPLIGVSGPASSQEKLTLTDALTLAYQTNPQLEAERANLRATDENISKALAGWRPSISANGSYGWQQQSGGPIPSAGTGQTSVLGAVSLNQPLFNGQTIPNARQAHALVDAERGQLLVTEESVLQSAAAAFFSVIRDETIVSLERDDIGRLKAILQNTQDRLRLGELTKTDVSQAKARLDIAIVNLAASESQLASSRAAFEHIVGRPSESLDRTASLPRAPSDELVAMDVALQNNPELIQSRAAERAAEHGVEVAFGALLPSASLQAQYGKNINSLSAPIAQTALSIVAQITVPLYQGGADEAAIRQARELRDKAMFDTMEAERHISENVRDAWAFYVAAQATQSVTPDLTTANQIAYEGSQLEALAGARTTIDILNADQELLQAQIIAATSNYNLRSAELQLLNTMGELTARALHLPVQIYDPEKHESGRWFGFGG